MACKQGLPRNLGDPELSTQRRRSSGSPPRKWPGPSGRGAHVHWERTEETLSGTAEAKATKRRGEFEKSEPLNRTEEVGEPTPGDPAEGRRRLGLRNFWRARWHGV